jgi:hypothetical protein
MQIELGAYARSVSVSHLFSGGHTAMASKLTRSFLIGEFLVIHQFAQCMHFILAEQASRVALTHHTA